MAKKENGKKRDLNKLFVRIMAGTLAGMTLLAACATLIFYFVY